MLWIWKVGGLDNRRYKCVSISSGIYMHFSEKKYKTMLLGKINIDGCGRNYWLPTSLICLLPFLLFLLCGQWNVPKAQFSRQNYMPSSSSGNFQTLLKIVGHGKVPHPPQMLCLVLYIYMLGQTVPYSTAFYLRKLEPKPVWTLELIQFPTFFLM